jgi:hypothetical protein
MSNSRPPGYRGPGKNNPPKSSSVPGAKRPPIEKGLNSWDGPTWSERNRPSSSPSRSLPPKTSSFSKTPPKPPGFNSPINSSDFKFGLGSVAGALAINLALELLFPPGVADATLPPWYQPPAAGPKNNSNDLNPVESYPVNPAKTYSVVAKGEIRRVETWSGGVATTDWLYGATHTEIQNYVGGQRIDYNTRPNLATHVYTISNAVLIGSPEFKRAFGFSGYPYWSYFFTVTFANGSKQEYLMGQALQESSNTTYSGLGASLSVTEVGSSTPVSPISPTPPSPVPPYVITEIDLGNPPLTAPTPSISPSRTNPSPFPAPGQNPLTSPSNPTPNNPSDPDEDTTPYRFPPFTPFPVNPSQTPLTRQFVKNDPVLFWNRNPSGSTTTNSFPSISPSTKPNSNPNSNPNANPSNNPNTNNNTNTTKPNTKPDDNKNTKPNSSPDSFPPLFPNPLNPKDPVINPTSPKQPPVTQTPSGNNCCVPTPVANGLNDINQKSDLLLEKMIDLSLLEVINSKLGPNVSGGLSGYLQERFTKLWKSRTIDRALNLMATAAAIHNAVMLSRNIGSTLIQTLGNALTIIGIKDGDDVAQNFSTVIGDGIENIIKGLIGAENYTTLSETWAKANRIYQSAINIYQLMTDSLFGITEGLEQTAKYTGKIGNALRKSGVVLENSYNWMSETFNFSSGKNRKIDRVIEGLQQASEVASDLESITSEFRSVTENVAEIGTQINTIKTEINGKEEDKKNNEDNSKNSSQSPQINKSDLNKTDN